MRKIVTKASFTALITRGDDVAVNAIGRALVHLFNRQTEDERRTDTTRNDNSRGFTPGDARQGSIQAKYYLKHRTLRDWQIRIWIKPGANGTLRLAKYWAQINEEANRKLEAAQ